MKTAIKTGRKGPITDVERTALHCELDRLIDLRNVVEAGGRRFRPPKRSPGGLPQRPSLRADNALPDMLLLHSGVIGLAASVAGEETLLQLQPWLDLEGGTVKQPGALRARFQDLFPGNLTQLARHKLVGLMWQESKLATGRNRKGPKGEVGEAYGLTQEAVSKWRRPCTERFGLIYVQLALDYAKKVDPELFYPMIFGMEQGRRSLEQCAHEYAQTKKAIGKRQGRPAKAKQQRSKKSARVKVAP